MRKAPNHCKSEEFHYLLILLDGSTAVRVNDIHYYTLKIPRNPSGATFSRKKMKFL